MLNNIFKGIFDGATTQTVISLPNFLLCILVSLGIGIFLSYINSYKGRSSKGFAVTLALLPSMVCVVIMMLNGNLGAGVAVAGAFSLVRFRSVPGTAREIGAIFIAMAAGLATGMGYLAFGILFTLIVGSLELLFTLSKFGERKLNIEDKTLNITIPEDLDYTGVFDDLFEDYTNKHELIHVKTTNMGSLFKLTYNISLKSVAHEKALIDALRCRNGNLEIIMTRQETSTIEL